MNSKEKFKFRKIIKELASIRGRHTELVTVYIPAGYDLNKIISHLSQEQGTASNIKDTHTRKNVIDSLEKMIRHLRLFKRTPPNGLTVFSGNASDKEGKVDIKVWSIEPPEQVNTRLYRCDHIFVLDLLKEMMETKEVYGLLVLDLREANIGLLKGTSIKSLVKMTSGVPGKIKAGGQSAARFARIREEAAKEFYKRIANACNKEFLNIKELKGIIVGGPGHSKNEFLDEGYLNQQLKDKVIATKDLSYTGDFGLQELLDKSQDVLAKEEVAKEKKLMGRFFELLAKEEDKVTYGLDQVKNALELGAVDILLISEDMDDDLVEELEAKAEELGSKFEMISVETREGVQLKELSGIAAILRFSIQ